jgi:hypothetical protein
LIISDQTNSSKLVKLMRKMRRHNLVPFQNNSSIRQVFLTYLIEDPNFRTSSDSYFIQAADLCAYILLQKIKPCKKMKSKGGQNYFSRLSPVLCKVASRTDPFGIVWL